MSLVDRLRRIGERVGILHAAPGTPRGAPVKLVPHETTIAELCAQVDPLTPGSAWPDPDAVHAAAGPAEGWTAPRVAALLGAELAGLAPAEAQAALLQRIVADGATPEDIVRDAIARDHALDAAATTTLAALRQLAGLRRGRLDAIAARIAELEAERRDLAVQTAADEQRWRTWWMRKHALEESLACAIRPLIDRPMVSVEPEPPAIG